jgi:TonB family protein
MPEYQGGQEQLMRDLGQTVVYPAAAKAAKFQGMVIVGFVIGADGKLQDLQIRKGSKVPAGREALAEELYQAALQGVERLPGTWEPGRQNGQPVAVSFTLPITFALRDYSNINAIFWSSC